MLSFIQTFGLLLLMITCFAVIVKLLKQPIIIGYVLSGIAFSVFFTSHQSIYEQMIIFSEMGITFLLFLIGLELDLKSLKYLGKDVLIATLVQSIVFFGIAFGLASLFGFTVWEKVYISILFMFSSTVLVAKWVNDKHESNSLHGKIVLSMLVIQDVIAIVFLTFISVFKESAIQNIILIPLKGLALVAIAVVLAKFALNPLLKLSSKYHELLFIIGLSVCFVFVEIASLLDYSTTIGAFIGGVVLANTAYRIDVSSKLKQLIIFFNMLFFVGLGFQINLGLSPGILIFIGLLCLLSLVLKPVVIYLTLRARNYDLKTSFLSGIYLAQLSEFGIIIVIAGVAGGFVSGDIKIITIISVILTMILSSYFIKYDKNIFKLFEKRLAKLDKKLIAKDVDLGQYLVECNIIFFGYYEISKAMLDKLQEMNKKIIVVENDPENIALLRKEGIRTIYSSVNDPVFFEHLNFEKIELAISSLTDPDENKLIIKHIKKNNPKALIIVSAKSLKESLDLYKHEADYVLYSSYLNEQKVSVLLEEYSTDINKVVEKKIADLAKLQEKEEKLRASKKHGAPETNAFMRKAGEEHKKQHPNEPDKESTSKRKKFRFLDISDFLKQSQQEKNRKKQE